MANNPNNLADIIDVTAKFIPPTATGVFGFTDPAFVSEFATSASFPGRIKAYTGSLVQKQTALVNDGCATTSAAYRQVTAGGAQGGPPRTIFVGRKDAGDADWPAALDAITVEADANDLGFYAVCADTRNVFDIEDIDDWTDDKFALYVGQTDNAAVRNNTAGNVAELILAKNHSRSALLWHDPVAASNFGPAVLTSIPGTFNIDDGADLKLRVDGGAEQTFTFNSAAATILGSNAETYAFSDGDQLDFIIDSGSAQAIIFSTTAATILSGNAETYNILDGDVLNARVDGGAVQPVTFNGTAGSVTTDPETFALADGETVTFAIDGGGNQIATFNTADFVAIGAATAAEVAAVYATDLTGVTLVTTTTVTVSSNRKGTSSDVEIVSGTGGALAALGYAAANNVGTGFAAFLDVATAAEVFAEINSDTAGLTAAADALAVRVTSDSVGTGSRIQISGGTANGVLAFDTNEVAGGGDFVDATAVTASEVVTKLTATALGVVAAVDTAAVRLTSRTRGTGSKIEITASTVATTLGLAVSVELGTGDFFNAALATASEVATEIGLTLTGAVASSASSAVVLTSSTSGSASELEITGGTLQTLLLFADSAGNADQAQGTGTDEDYLDCAWVGRCITFQLDRSRASGGGQSTWDNHTLVGVFADTDLTEAERNTLHDTLQVNTYENRNGRDETHFGTLLNDVLEAGRYIDVRVTLDWLKARTVEGFKRILDELADSKKKASYTDADAARFDTFFREMMLRSQTNGHTIFDDSPLNPDDPTSTGILTPTVAGQTAQDISNRLCSGFATRQVIQGAIQRARATIELIGPGQ